ncbi:MAG TPA: hypothetical protein VGA02_11480 [Gemmatimonadales bacterium]
MTEPQQQESPKQEPEPDVSGTVFLMALFLMATIGLWVIMYLKLIGR